MTSEMIKNRLKIISDLNQEINRAKVLYEETLEENPSYQETQEQEEEIKETKKKIKQKKEVVLENPQLKEIGKELKELRQELKENKEVLSQQLADYYKESGSLEITDEDGNVKRIKFTAKLVNL